jgi:predicted O-linked N-acetylglucosamine transferase (SPINDLY family)
VSGSILTAAGLTELVCTTLDDYEVLALNLATDGDALRALRARIAQAQDQAPLFDSSRFARDLERLYENMIAARPAS